MKKSVFYLIASFMLLAFQPLGSLAAANNATTNIVVTKTDKTDEAAKAKSLLLRLDEIKAMDKSKLNSSEKKSLRKEVREIRRELTMTNGGIYLSVGAIIIIILLLIILL